MASTSSSKLQQICTAERRKKILLGELPADFLRLTLPSVTANANAPMTQVVITDDPVLIQQQEYLRAQHAFYSFVPPNTCGRISITIVEAKLAKNYGLVRMDPYCRIRIGNTVFETPTSISGGKSPKWNRIVNAYLPYGVESVYLQVFDERAFTVDECIAWSHIVLPNGIFNGEVIDDWYQLSGQQGEGKEGAINLITSFTPVDASPGAYMNISSVPQREANAAITNEDVSEMQAMFPSIDMEIIRCILEEKNGNKEAAVSAILEMTAES